MMSSAIIYIYIKTIGGNKITPLFHIAKAHGLSRNSDEDMVLQVIESNSTLLIAPDSTSNDYIECEILANHGIDTIVCDHHEIEFENNAAIVVNHHLRNDLNHDLSGTGVTYKLIQAHAEKYKKEFSSYIDSFQPFVAISLISDICNMASIENRLFVKNGIEKIVNKKCNQMLIAMSEKFNRRGMNQIGFAWGVIPPINALCRCGEQEDKENFFYSLVGKAPIESGLQILSEVHDKQSKLTRQAFSEVEKTIDHSHAVSIGFADSRYKAIIGLAANKFLTATGKPTIILRENDKNTWSGSLRSPIDIAKQINESGLASCMGHQSAAGILLDKSNLDALISWFDNQPLDTEPTQTVAGILSPSDIEISLCDACESYTELWSGSEQGGLPQPKFYIEFESNPSMIEVYANRTKTVKFKFSNCNIMKFRAKTEDVDNLLSGICKIKATVTLSSNEWNGIITPQAIIEEYSIEPVEQQSEEFSWEDLFK